MKTRFKDKLPAFGIESINLVNKRMKCLRTKIMKAKYCQSIVRYNMLYGRRIKYPRYSGTLPVVNIVTYYMFSHTHQGLD